MKAVVLENHGGLDSLKYREDVELSPLRSNQVRIHVKYCALNHLDLWLRRGGTGDKLSLPRIPGSDIFGVVTEVGSEVTHLSRGDAVLVYPGVGCGHCPACAKGRETMCPRFQIIGYHLDGGYAEYVDVPGQSAIKIEHDDWVRWAATPVSYITAWNALVTKGGLTANDTVVIWGATGGLGYAALSIAVGFGARAIAVVGSEEKASFLRQQGFSGDCVVRGEGMEEKIRKLTGKVGATLVLDHVGSKTWKTSLGFLARGGRLVSCGVTTGYLAETDLRYIFGKQISIFGSWMGDRSDFLEVIRFLQNHPQHLPYVYKQFSLKEAREAQQCLEAGEHVGKIVLAI
jgi:NADPH:quinone reductase-like Zn-dependent oxidoreductase